MLASGATPARPAECGSVRRRSPGSPFRSEARQVLQPPPVNGSPPNRVSTVIPPGFFEALGQQGAGGQPPTETATMTTLPSLVRASVENLRNTALRLTHAQRTLNARADAQRNMGQSVVLEACSRVQSPFQTEKFRLKASPPSKRTLLSALRLMRINCCHN